MTIPTVLSNRQVFQTINGWTKDKMIIHIQDNFKGKAFRLEDEHKCFYRGSEGTACGVGLFIPEKIYHAAMDYPHSLRADEMIPKFGLSDVMPLSLAGMLRMQQVHDGSSEWLTLSDLLKFVESEVVDSPAPWEKDSTVQYHF